MKITIIAACDNNNLIGINGQIPWHLPKDLRRFKDLTMGHAVIMGRGTYESLDRKPLPSRYNIVLTSNPDYDRNRSGVVFVNSHNEALKACTMAGHDEVFIIGGEDVYATALQYADRILLTRIDEEYGALNSEGRRYFPTIPDTFELTYLEGYPKRNITFETWSQK
jgi:dihydrofolate reductase